MEQLQRRRQRFRLAIRRNDLDSRMNVVRDRLAMDLRAANCVDFINGLKNSNPSSLFMELANYIFNCSPSERSPWALTCYEMLISQDFSHWRHGFEGLPSLLLVIFDQLGQRERRLLPSPPIIEALLQQLEQATLCGSVWSEDLFRVTFQLSIYASEQSNFHINFSEEKVENIIYRALNYTTIGNLQILAAVLVNLREDDLRGCHKQKIKQLGSRLQKNLNFAKNRILYLQVITAIGLHNQFEESQIDILRIILDYSEQLDFSLVLRLLTFQSYEEWMSYKLAEKFLEGCPSRLEDIQQVSSFLIIISNICRSEAYCQNTLMKIYRNFFQGKLHHFINEKTIYVITDLIVTFCMEHLAQIEEELSSCALKIIKTAQSKMIRLDQSHLMMLCNYLIINKKITENELYQYLGAEKYEDFWRKFQELNQNDD